MRWSDMRHSADSEETSRHEQAPPLDFATPTNEMNARPQNWEHLRRARAKTKVASAVESSLRSGLKRANPREASPFAAHLQDSRGRNTKSRHPPYLVEHLDRGVEDICYGRIGQRPAQCERGPQPRPVIPQWPSPSNNHETQQPPSSIPRSSSYVSHQGEYHRVHFCSAASPLPPTLVLPP